MHDSLQGLLRSLDAVILGKPAVTRLSVTCLLAGGHLLLEDLPGVGKTTLAHALAKLSGLQFQRLQFTSDMLPSDILGVSIYHRETNTFTLQRGPVFTQVLLADEINRATPRAQSALLEAMQEGQVTLEGSTHALLRPFFVIATQNPREQIGTYPLPESQLDRFLMRLSLGYPAPAAERQLLRGEERRGMIEALQPILDAARFLELQAAVGEVHVSDAMLDYLQAVLTHTRRSADYACGLSPRAGLALLRATRAWALLEGRKHCVPEDLQAVLPSVAGRRLVARDGTRTAEELGAALVAGVPIP
ncbi:MAG: MoxR family ATPase [Gammaproteobacteria bacterium]|nr:MoxR family ATPase [Gammaproteobacteria bacterium]